jgi:hypothetical protein
LGVALRDIQLVAARRAALLCAVAGLTVLLGVGLVIEATKHGVPAPIIPLAIAGPVWLVSTRRTGVALVVVLLYLGLLDGVVKLETGAQATSLGRDVLLYAVAIGMALRSQRPVRMPPLSGWVFAWIAVILVQLANPGNISLYHSFASLRQDLEFVPLFFIAFAALRTRKSLRTLFALLLAVATINAVVAVYQSTLTPAQLSSWGHGYANLLSGPSARLFNSPDGKQHIRPPALGSDEGFGGDLGATAIPGGIALLILYRRRRSLLVLISLGVIGAAVGVLTSQARSAIAIAVVALLAFFALVAVGRQAGRALIGLLVVAAIAVVAVELTGSYSDNAFARFGSIAPGSATSTIESARSSTWSAIPVYLEKVPFGAGLGLVGPAATDAGGTGSNWNGESEFTYLIVEAGAAGLLVLTGFALAISRLVFTGIRRERDTETVLLLAGVAAPLFGYFVGWLVGVYSAVSVPAPYFWFAAGVLSWWLVARQREIRAAAARGDSP